MSFAKPIIGVLQGDGRQILEESQGSFLCEENAQSVATAIEEVAKLDKEAKEKLGHNNQVYHHSHFALDYVGKAVNDTLLEELR